MLIGNKAGFAFEIHPVEPSWELRYEPEATAWAALTVWAEGRNLCAHVREGEENLRSAFFVPLGPLADWIVRSYPGIALEERAPWVPTASRRLHQTVREWGDRRPPSGVTEDTWLDERDAFWARHFLTSGAEGAWVPNLAFMREDDDVVLTWAPPRFASAPVVTMLNPSGVAVVPWADVAGVMKRFVDEVASAFRAKNCHPFVWIDQEPRLTSSGSDFEALRLFCSRPLQEIASLFGVTVENLASVLPESTRVDPAASPICQVLRDLPPMPSPGVGQQARSTVDASANSRDPIVRGAWIRARSIALDAARSGGPPEECGQLAARRLREHLHLNGAPIASTADLLPTLGVTLRSDPAPAMHERMLVASATGGTPVATVLRTPRTETPWGQRFEEARALGHALLDPLRGDAFGAASTQWAQETRRRRSGAFAAELLLPASSLDGASSGHLDGVCAANAFVELLERYNVGAQTAAHQLYNNGWLSSASLRDELIALHASHENLG